VVNTCAFIEAARHESIETISSSPALARGARLVVTGCLAERYGDELAASMPEIDLVAASARPSSRRPDRRRALAGDRRHACLGRSSDSQADPGVRSPRVAEACVVEPLAYVKIAEGCDRRCAYCAIPSFRGRQRSGRPKRFSKRSILSAFGLRGGAGRPGPCFVGLDRSAARRATGAPRPSWDCSSGWPNASSGSDSSTSIPRRSTARSSTRCARPGALFRPVAPARLEVASTPYAPTRPQRAFQGLIGHIRAVAPQAALRSNFILGFPARQRRTTTSSSRS